MGKKAKAGEEDALTRIAIVNNDKCKPKKCRQVKPAITTTCLKADQLISFHWIDCSLLVAAASAPTGMQEDVSSCAYGQTVYRSGTYQQGKQLFSQTAC
jgi:Possible Fer4-like domain in RNase L inhibitor, RLI